MQYTFNKYICTFIHNNIHIQVHVYNVHIDTDICVPIYKLHTWFIYKLFNEYTLYTHTHLKIYIRC